MQSGGYPISDRFLKRLYGNSLHLKNMQLVEGDMFEVVSFLNRNPQINTVNLARNRIGDEGFAYFARKTRYITQADFSYNRIGTQGAIDFARENKRIRKLSLERNRIGTSGILELSKCHYIHKLDYYSPAILLRIKIIVDKRIKQHKADYEFRVKLISYMLVCGLKEDVGKQDIYHYSLLDLIPMVAAFCGMETKDHKTEREFLSSLTHTQFFKSCHAEKHVLVQEPENDNVSKKIKYIGIVQT